MKRKTLVLLSSIMASAFLVGGAFAAYAVTDNADPFGINVTPGDLEETGGDYVSLNWGDVEHSKRLASVGNLTPGEYRRAGIVSLVASETYTGRFTVTVNDNTDDDVKEAKTDDYWLLDYLDVFVYSGGVDLVDEGLPASGLVGSILRTVEADEDGKKSLSISATGIPAGSEYTVFVHLDTSAGSVVAGKSIIDVIKDDSVYLEVDWNKNPSDKEVDGRVVYTYMPDGWNDLNAFAWGTSGKNGEWPGVAMTKLTDYDNVYTILIPAGMENIIFNDNVKDVYEGDIVHQTIDLTFEGYTAATPYWNGETWAELPAKTQNKVLTATVNGEAFALGDNKASGTDKGEFHVTLAVEDKLVVKGDNVALPLGDSEVTEFTVKTAGEHVIYVNKDYKVYISEPVVEVNYYVVGTIGGANKWASTDYKLVPNTAAEGEYLLEEPITLAAGDGIKVMSSGSAYFPDGSNNEWIIQTAGEYQVYFRPAGNSAWENGYFFVAPYVAPSND